jgi:type VI secretion system secreted protein Hcp
MAAYCKFDGIDGESKDKDHIGWIDLESFSQGYHSTGGGQTGQARRGSTVVVNDISMTKYFDKASHKLAEAVLNGKVFPKVEIHFTASYSDQNEGRKAYMVIEMKNVRVSSWNLAGSGGQSGDRPMEQVACNYEDIRSNYIEYDKEGKKKGNVEYTWKVEEGEA